MQVGRVASAPRDGAREVRFMMCLAKSKDVLGKVEMNNVFCRLCSLKSGFSVVEVGSVWLKWVEVSSVWLKWVQCG